MSLCPEQKASPTLDRVLAQLRGVRTSLRGWRACCPAHGDLEPSLSIGLGEQGQVLLRPTVRITRPSRCSISRWRSSCPGSFSSTWA